MTPTKKKLKPNNTPECPSPTTFELQEKRRKNRAAAAKCRQKKRASLAELNEEKIRLQIITNQKNKENQQLKNECDELFKFFTGFTIDEMGVPLIRNEGSEVNLIDEVPDFDTFSALAEDFSSSTKCKNDEVFASDDDDEDLSDNSNSENTQKETDENLINKTLNPDDKMSPFIRIANLLTTLNSQETHVLNQISEQQKLNDQRNHYQSLANEIAEDVNLHINEIEANGNFKMDDNCWGMIRKVSDIFSEERERFYERYGYAIGEIRFGYGNMEKRNKTNYIEWGDLSRVKSSSDWFFWS